MECEICDKALQQMVLSIYNAMVSKNKVPALSYKEMTNIITQVSKKSNEQETDNKDVVMNRQQKSQAKQISEGYPKDGAIKKN